VCALHDFGAKRAVALVGFDDIAFADVVRPGLTVLAQDPVALGRAAAEQLFARLARDTGASRRIEVGVELTARGSGELRAPRA
jgi:LacI family transcriptional regulator